MTTKVIRIESDCYDTIIEYAKGGSATDGVREMEKQIRAFKEKESANTVTSATPVSLPSFGVPAMRGGMTMEYWKELKKELETFIERAQRGF